MDFVEVEMMTGRRFRQQRGGSLAETGPALWLFFLFILFPLIDLISFGIGVSTVMLVATWGARQAATCSTFSDAQKSILQTEASLSGFQKCAKMSPLKGTSGVDISVQVSKTDGSSSQMYSYANRATIPNSPPDDATNPVSPPTNTGNSIYQYVVTGSYNVQPMFNFSGAPFLSGIPALGAPVPVTFTSNASVEHPDGLQN